MKIIYKTLDGIAIVIPAPDCGLTVERIAQKDVPQGVEYTIVKDSAVPSDREFRNAWKFTDKVEVDILKAQEITKNRLRTERAPLLANLDIQFMKALESNSDASLILSEKQRLRDITKLVDPMSTVEELKAVKCV